MLCARVHCPRLSRDPDVTLIYLTMHRPQDSEVDIRSSCSSAVNKLPGQSMRDQSILPIHCFFLSFFFLLWFPLLLGGPFPYLYTTTPYWCTICPGMRANQIIQQGIYNDRHVANPGSCVCSHLVAHPIFLVYIAISRPHWLFWIIGKWFIVLFLLIGLDKHHRFLQIQFGARGARRVQFCQFTIDLI